MSYHVCFNLISRRFPASSTPTLRTFTVGLDGLMCTWTLNLCETFECAQFKFTVNGRDRTLPPRSEIYPQTKRFALTQSASERASWVANVLCKTRSDMVLVSDTVVGSVWLVHETTEKHTVSLWILAILHYHFYFFLFFLLYCFVPGVLIGTVGKPLGWGHLVVLARSCV